jgi:hypothetical protein
MAAAPAGLNLSPGQKAAMATQTARSHGKKRSKNTKEGIYKRKSKNPAIGCSLNSGAGLGIDFVVIFLIYKVYF